MTQFFLFTIIMGLFAIGYLLIGLFSSKKIKTPEEFFLMSRQLTFFPALMSLIATDVGGGVLLGTAENAFEIGWYGITYGLGLALGYFILSTGFAAKLQSFKVRTTSQLFRTHYNSITLNTIGSSLATMTLTGILIAQMIASQTLLASITLYHPLIYLFVWISIIVYTVYGGLRAVVNTDIFQTLFFSIILGSIFMYLLVTQFTTITQVLTTEQVHQPETLQIHNLFGTFFVSVLFTVIAQIRAQRFYAFKNGNDANKAAFWTGIFILLFTLGSLYFGMYAQEIELEIVPGTNPFIATLREKLSPTFFIFGICALIAAILSTADSILCAIASIVYGLAEPFSKKMEPINRSRIVTIVIGVIALIVSFFIQQNIIQLLRVSYKISVSCLLVPLMACFFTTKPKLFAAYGGIIGGMIGLVLFSFWQPPFAKEVIIVLMSVIGYAIGWINF